VTAEPAAPEVPIGPLGRRLRVAFVAVAVGSLFLVTVAALIGTDRGLATASANERMLVASRAASAAADAYRAAGGWEGADLGPATAVAAGAGAELAVVETGDVSHMGGSGRGHMGRGATVTAPVVVDGRDVGTVQLAFPTPAGSAARAVAWWWILAAAAGALGLALLAAHLVTRRVSRPLASVAATARTFATGDHGARTGISGVGEIGEVARALDDMAEEVVASEHARQRAAADVAHELRTPLAALQAGLEEARDGLVSASPELLAGLHDQSLRLGRIVSDLAALSAAESGTLQLRRQRLDLAELARQEVASQQPRMRAADLTVVADAAGPVPVDGDPDRLRQVVDNLLSNSGRYCRPGDTVTVTVRALDRAAVLEVCDTGPGIAPEDLPHVFDRLWRGQEADRVGGSGIGLAVVQGLVTAHGGTVAAESDGRSGTTLRVELPLGPAPS
jgi:two-component system sensor histidine kinase BaeS